MKRPYDEGRFSFRLRYGVLRVHYRRILKAIACYFFSGAGALGSHGNIGKNENGQSIPDGAALSPVWRAWPAFFINAPIIVGADSR